MVATSLVGWGLWGLSDKGALRTMQPMSITLTYSVISTFVYAVITVVTNQKFNITWDGLKWVILGVIGGNTAFLAFIHALRHNEAGTMVSLTSAYPLVTMLLAWLFLGEAITASKVFGAVIIVIGGYLITR